MLRLALKNLAARKFRLLTSAIAVILGVAFVAGTLVLGDTITHNFDNLFTDVYKGTDAQVRAVKAFDDVSGGGGGGSATRPSIEASLLPLVERTPGVAKASASIFGYTQVVDRKGKAIGKPGQGPPTLGSNWQTVPELNSYHLVQGHAPRADDEIVLDNHSAKEGPYRVGDAVPVLTLTGRHELKLVGIAKFGRYDSAAGTTHVMFTLDAAERFIGERGRATSIDVVADDGVSQSQVRANLAKAIPKGAEAITGKALIEENQTEVGKFVGIFNKFMLAFALIALFVGSFIIYNTFSILVAQRMREMALLRAIGASRRQVRTSLVLEALATGLLASVVGAVTGVGVALGLKGLLAAFGFDLPANGLTVRPNAMITAIAMGTIVTVAASWFPARRGAKVPPIAAMRDVALEQRGRPAIRLSLGGLLTAVGLLALFSGLGGGDGALPKVGLGAVLILLGVASLGPIAARPVTRVLGRPVAALRGVTGVLARENAMRNPRRTATTASALLIGVALVGFITIFASSAKQSVHDIFEKQFTGDYVLDTQSFGFGGVSTSMAGDLRKLPQIAAVSSMRNVVAQFNGSSVQLLGLDAKDIGAIADLGVVRGSLDDLDATSVAVLEDKAREEGWTIGTRVPVRFADTGAKELTVKVIYRNKDLAKRYWVDNAVFDANVRSELDTAVLVKLAHGVSIDQARPAIAKVAKTFANVKVQDREQFIKAQSSQINQLLAFIYVLLFLALIIALFGITNTLVLSVVERTRELGLLRAVGMTRSQLRTMIRWEAVLIALFGTVGGLGVGIFFGWAFIHALADEGFHTFKVPVAQLAIICILAAFFGVVAALLPARRAARLNVLDAIATN